MNPLEDEKDLVSSDIFPEQNKTDNIIEHNDDDPQVIPGNTEPFDAISTLNNEENSLIGGKALCQKETILDVNHHDLGDAGLSHANDNVTSDAAELKSGGNVITTHKTELESDRNINSNQEISNQNQNMSDAMEQNKVEKAEVEENYQQKRSSDDENCTDMKGERGLNDYGGGDGEELKNPLTSALKSESRGSIKKMVSVADREIPDCLVQRGSRYSGKLVGRNSRFSGGQKRGFRSQTKSPTKSISTIDIDITRMIEADSEIDATESIAMVTTKSVDFTLPYEGDEVDAELARIVNKPMDDNSSLTSDMIRGRIATTNTPVEGHYQLQSRGLSTPSREHIYEHALNLIKNRCTSNHLNSRYSFLTQSGDVPGSVYSVYNDGETTYFSLPALLANINDPPIANSPNNQFFITQRWPLPLQPLKVWKGYHSNVFFEPLVCKKMVLRSPVSNAKEDDVTKINSPRGEGTKLPSLPSKGSKLEVPVRAKTAQTWHGRGNHSRSDNNKSRLSLNYRPGTRKMSILDKQTVISRMDHHVGEDITWINGIEAVGNLRIGQSKRRSSAHFYDNTTGHHKLKICRGLVSHRLANKNVGDASLDVRVGKIKDSVNDMPVKCRRPSTSATEAFDYAKSGGAFISPRSLKEKRVVLNLKSGNEIVDEYVRRPCVTKS